MEARLGDLKNQAAFIGNMQEPPPSQAVKNERLIRLNTTILETETSLAAAREIYRDDHPDIRTFRKKLEVLKRERDLLAQEDETAQARAAVSARPSLNPQVARSLEEVKSSISTLQAQIRAKDLDVEHRIKQQAELSRAIQGYQARIEMGPANEQAYAALLREHGIAKAKYEEMAQKKELSETALNLEERKVGENLEVLDQASLPEQPAEPNRLLIAVSGVGVEIGRASCRERV